MAKKTKVLVLDNTWLPFAVCNYFDALCKVFAGRARVQATVINDENPVFRTTRRNHPIDKICPVCDSSRLNRVGITNVRVCNSCGIKFRLSEDGILEIFKPSVIIMTEYRFKDKHNSVRFSKRNLFARDNYMCAYCGEYFSQNDLTIDHIIPKSHDTYNRENGSGWMNCVSACKPCNNKKGDKTLAEAKMKLLYNPSIPSYAPRFYIKKEIASADESWWDFLGKKDEWINEKQYCEKE